jgi:hypothetical protein
MVGQRFRLKSATIAVNRAPERDEILHVPEGAEILVLDRACPEVADPPNQQVFVEWNGRIYSMFVVDIQERGELIHTISKSKCRGDAA